MTKLHLRRVFLALAFTLAVSLGGPVFAQTTIGGAMRGYQEAPSVSTAGTGIFVAKIDAGETTINYQLSYSNLEGTATASHIHIAQPGVNGGIVAALCGAGGKPACPASGTVTGSITAADILALPPQGIAAGELAEVIAAIRAGVAYVNLHSDAFPSGEIRGQIRTF